MKTVILIRHGQSTFNAHYERTGEDPGHVDAPLTALGREQVEDARRRLSDVEVDLVISSPLTRALQTSTGIFGHRPLPFHVTCRHRERLESTCDVGRRPDALQADFPGIAFDHLDERWWHHDPEEPERIAFEPESVFHRRVESFREWLRAHESERTAVVGHATFFHALTGRWLQNCEVLAWDPHAN